MTDNDDIRALLPEPPPPAPKPRESAITVALARFDGTAPQKREAPPPTAPWWKSLQRPQAGLLATAALVAAISLPLAWKAPIVVAPAVEEKVLPQPGGEAPAAPRDQAIAQPASTPHDVAAAPIAIPAKPPATEKDATGVAAATPRSDDVAPAAKRVDMAQAAPAAPPPPPPAVRVAESAPIVVQGRAASRPLQDTPLAVSAVSSEELARDEGREVIVTATRMTKSEPARRGDWNACTVNDPRRALPQCRKLADKAAAAVRDQANAHLADGLKHAWDGDLDKAIAAFDAAIAIAPDLSAAYLNRGLVHDRQGDSEAALADLDRAVRLSPKSARAYYNRGVLLRKYANPERAVADERRAMDLDPRYRAILR